MIDAFVFSGWALARLVVAVCSARLVAQPPGPPIRGAAGVVLSGEAAPAGFAARHLRGRANPLQNHPPLLGET